MIFRAKHVILLLIIIKLILVLWLIALRGHE